MSRIKSLKLSNFKFFKEEETIKLDGKHLLLYGENGSGKSSVFWGLYTLLESSMKTARETEKYFKPLASSDESLVNIYANEMSCISSRKAHYDSYIELEDNNSVKYILSLLDNSICGNNGAKESRKATDFINYQAIFKFQEFKNSETPDLYNVFCYSILPYVTFGPITLKGKPLSNANDMWKEYQIGPGTTTNSKGDTIQVHKHSQDYIDFVNFERHFDSALAALIDFINTEALGMMKKLGYNMGFKLEYTSPTFEKKYKQYIPTPFKVVLCITHYNNKSVTVRKPHTFLNEAKMAAVATAIRLLVLNHRVSSAVENALNVLVLDDVMISLDMSNRDRLMDLLLDEYASKYQMLFLTHDKSLYNFVDYKLKQHKQDNDWLRKEMYIGECEYTKQEFPVIIDGECEALEKAKKFFQAKDYTTTAVYIRQTIEKIFSEAVPDEVKRNIDNKMKDKFIPLNNTWQQVKRIHKNIPKHVQDLFDQSKLMILNPSAHNQRLSQPIYRRELQDAFKLIDKLQELHLQPDILLIEKGKRIIFRHPNENYSFDFELSRNLVRNCITGDDDPKCKIHTWQYNGTEFYDFATGGVNTGYASSNPKFSRLKAGLFALNLTPAVDENCFLDNTTIEKSTLREALK